MKDKVCIDPFVALFVLCLLAVAVLIVLGTLGITDVRIKTGSFIGDYLINSLLFGGANG